MNVLLRPAGLGRRRHIIAIVCAALLLPGNAFVAALHGQQAAQESVKIPADQLDALVAPIALYPDPMLSQTLVASTYPLEIIQLQQWLEKNQGLKDKALVDAVSKQPWDPSVQAMAALPQVVKRLADDIQWATDLGNAFLAQQSEVMDAVQRMRTKAQGTGALASNQHQNVETKVIENKTIIEVQQAQPDVVYVPEYNPVAVYGPPVYPYPPIYYPSYSAGDVFAASAISWGVGVAMGAAWGGGWGWGAGWGHNDIDMNFNNNFNRNNFNRNSNISGNRIGDNTWRHNPQHRGGAPYADRATANRFGSNTRGDSLASRQKGAQQAITRQKGNLPSVGERGGVGNRPGGGNLGGNRPGSGNIAGNRPGGGNLGGGVGDRGGISNRPGGGNIGGAGISDRSRIGGSDRIGNRSVGGGSSYHGGFGGGSFNGSAARSSHSRGSSSFSGGRSRGGGGFSGGGGGRSRGGGGGRSRGGGRR